jgi:hypothetical protein
MLRRLFEALTCYRVRIHRERRWRACVYLLLCQPLAFKLVPEPLHIVMQSARFVSQRYKICRKPIGGIVIGRLKSLVEKQQLGAQIADMLVKILMSE